MPTTHDFVKMVQFRLSELEDSHIQTLLSGTSEIHDREVGIIKGLRLASKAVADTAIKFQAGDDE
jgi:hypothetical protein